MTLRVEYSILTAFLALLWAIVAKFFPDAPINPDVLAALVLYALAKLGVEVVGKPTFRAFFPSKKPTYHNISE